MAGLFDDDGGTTLCVWPSLVLVTAVDKEGKGSDKMNSQNRGDGRNQVANPAFVIDPNPHKQSKIVSLHLKIC